MLIVDYLICGHTISMHTEKIPPFGSGHISGGGVYCNAKFNCEFVFMYRWK